MKNRPVVLGYYFNSEERAVSANVAAGSGAAEGHLRWAQRRLPRWSGYTRQPARSTAERSRRRPHQSGDRRRRRAAPRAAGRSSSRAQYYEALSLAMVRALLARQTGKAS